MLTMEDEKSERFQTPFFHWVELAFLLSSAIGGVRHHQLVAIGFHFIWFLYVQFWQLCSGVDGGGLAIKLLFKDIPFIYYFYYYYCYQSLLLFLQFQLVKLSLVIWFPVHPHPALSLFLLLSVCLSVCRSVCLPAALYLEKK